jgi:hypothetical protein
MQPEIFLNYLGAYKIWKTKSGNTHSDSKYSKVSYVI